MPLDVKAVQRKMEGVVFISIIFQFEMEDLARQWVTWFADRLINIINWNSYERKKIQNSLSILCFSSFYHHQNLHEQMQKLLHWAQNVHRRCPHPHLWGSPLQLDTKKEHVLCCSFKPHSYRLDIGPHVLLCCYWSNIYIMYYFMYLY